MTTTTTTTTFVYGTDQHVSSNNCVVRAQSFRRRLWRLFLWVGASVASVAVAPCWACTGPIGGRPICGRGRSSAIFPPPLPSPSTFLRFRFHSTFGAAPNTITPRPGVDQQSRRVHSSPATRKPPPSAITPPPPNRPSRPARTSPVRPSRRPHFTLPRRAYLPPPPSSARLTAREHNPQARRRSGNLCTGYKIIIEPTLISHVYLNPVPYYCYNNNNNNNVIIIGQILTVGI